jgi:hypothetical protein
MAILTAVFLFTEVAHPLLLIDHSSGELVLPFLPLMTTSTVCALLLLPCWLQSLLILLYDDENDACGIDKQVGGDSSSRGVSSAGSKHNNETRTNRTEAGKDENALARNNQPNEIRKKKKTKQ